MMASARPNLAALAVALPALLLGGELAMIAPQLLPAMTWPTSPVSSSFAAPETTTIVPGRFAYRLSGAYLSNGRPVDGPVETAGVGAPLVLTTNQISAADYRNCVADGACEPVKGMPDRADLPATGVSFDDASAYAAWLSAKTGATWRLPTDIEWAYAAGSRFNDDALGVDDRSDNPAVRWLAAYRVSAGRDAPSGPQPAGSYGTNENGLNDLAGNVWEWTSTCYDRTTLTADASIRSVVTNCGVRVAEGVHRAYISRFIRDAKGGGCAAGIPPELFGFRLVRETPWWQDPLAPVRRLFGIQQG